MELLELREDRTIGEHTSMELLRTAQGYDNQSILGDGAIRLHKGATLGLRQLRYRGTLKE
jgi:hypothetical protein